MSFYSRAFLLEKLFFSASLYFIAPNKNQLISDSQPHLHSKYNTKGNNIKCTSGAAYESKQSAFPFPAFSAEFW